MSVKIPPSKICYTVLLTACTPRCFHHRVELWAVFRNAAPNENHAPSTPSMFEGDFIGFPWAPSGVFSCASVSYRSRKWKLSQYAATGSKCSLAVSPVHSTAKSRMHCKCAAFHSCLQREWSQYRSHYCSQSPLSLKCPVWLSSTAVMPPSSGSQPVERVKLCREVEVLLL